MRSRIGMGVLVFLLICVTAFAQEDRLTRLKKKIIAQQQILKKLESKIEAKEKTSRDYTHEIVDQYLANPAAKDEGGLVAGYNKGFFIQTGDGNYKLKINGYLRMHAVFFDTSTVQDNSFIPSEARIDFHIYIHKHLHIRIRPDFAANGAMREGYAEYLALDYLKPRVGAFIAPFSMTLNVAPHDVVSIMYSPMYTSLPFRDVGAMIHGNGLPFLLGEFFSDYFSYAVGMFNGTGTNSLNVDDDFLMVASGKIYPLTRKESKIFFHMAAMMGRVQNNATGARLRLFNFMRNDRHDAFGGTDSTGAARAEDDVNGRQVGVDVGFTYRKDNLRLETEFVWVRYNRDPVAPTTTESKDPLEMYGVEASATYFIGLGDPKQGMGVEPLVKMSYAHIDDEGNRPVVGSEIAGQAIWEIVLGVKFHINKHARFDFNWVMYDLEETNGYTNKKDAGGDLIHSFVSQFTVKW